MKRSNEEILQMCREHRGDEYKPNDGVFSNRHPLGVVVLSWIADAGERGLDPGEVAGMLSGSDGTVHQYKAYRMVAEHILRGLLKHKLVCQVGGAFLLPAADANEDYGAVLKIIQHALVNQSWRIDRAVPHDDAPARRGLN